MLVYNCRQISDGTADGIMLPRVIRQSTFADTQPVFRGEVPADQPRFVVAYRHGVIQLMCSESDASEMAADVAQVARANLAHIFL